MREFFLLFFTQCLSYFLITANYRAIARGSYGWTAVTDLFFASVNFFMIKKVAKSDTKAAWLGYTCGGVCGSLLAILLTKMVFGG